ncbi:MAG: hypothetical protein QM820_20250 [Minicystis sp.]
MTSSSTGGTGGMMMCSGGAKSCTTTAECDAPANECVTVTCDQGCCGTTNKPDDTPLATQVSGNCKKEVCKSGAPDTTSVDDTDVPADQDDCNTGACNNGTPEQTPKADNTPCTSNNGQVCLAGACVECISDNDCNAPEVCDPVSSSHACVSPFCTDMVQNGKETDQDCGGVDAGSGCAPCADNKKCLIDTDCTNGYCDTSLAQPVCKTPTCTDGVQNGGETDKDCGGTTCVGQNKLCANGLKCAANSDCTSAYCDTSVTPAVCKAPTCNDGVLNGNETDKDCGGGAFQGGNACPKCAVGKVCSLATDCSTGLCNGGVCATKPDGAQCGLSGGDSECTSGHCVDNACCDTACSSKCQACNVSDNVGTCTNVPMGQADSHPICAGTLACNGFGACLLAPGQPCMVNSDCASGTCSTGTPKVCLAAERF